MLMEGLASITTQWTQGLPSIKCSLCKTLLGTRTGHQSSFKSPVLTGKGERVKANLSDDCHHKSNIETPHPGILQPGDSFGTRSEPTAWLQNTWWANLTAIAKQGGLSPSFWLPVPVPHLPHIPHAPLSHLTLPQWHKKLSNMQSVHERLHTKGYTRPGKGTENHQKVTQTSGRPERVRGEPKEWDLLSAEVNC